MAYVIVPLTQSANQGFTCTLPVDAKNLTLAFTFAYNGVADYWFMSIADVKTNTLLLDAVPLVTGSFPAANILEQYEYLGVGSAAIVPTSSLAKDRPGDTDLGTEYVLVWGDTLG